MRKENGTFWLLILLCSMRSFAQLSPGDLAQPHAELEGMFNCTKCHTIGEKISNDKCLDCHKPLQSRIKSNKGYHASKEVKGKSCTECHSDHHGRKFEMIRFDKDQFNHGLTGYKLEGAHGQIDCRACHKPENVVVAELKKNEDTFLGLGQDCLSCHDDFHNQSLPKDCQNCHDFYTFEKASRFDHNKTDFPLLGKHQNVDCRSCHVPDAPDANPFQAYREPAFGYCNSCHEDPHRQNLGSNCQECHTESSFQTFIGQRKFNHNRTDFALKGAHQKTDCKSCHSLSVSPVQLFQDKKGILTSECAKCHEDVHENRFGSNCAECHQEKSFRVDLKSLDAFNHKLTNFPLKGKHEAIDCRACHTGQLTDPLPYQTCNSCHADYHEGIFQIAGKATTDCAQCHEESGFDQTLYGLEEHKESRFPLEGAHQATPCFSCHLDESKWAFRNIGERCVDCHENVHGNSIPEQYFPDRECKACHQPESWSSVTFDHAQTEFALEGAHLKQKCDECHRPKDEKDEISFWRFSNLPSDCMDCHADPHFGQFEKAGSTNCQTCHGFEKWMPSTFDHQQAAFKLEGRHAEITCNSCHKEVQAGEYFFVQYKFESFECSVCHQ